MMKKLVKIVVSVMMTLSLCACGSSSSKESTKTSLKAGFIFLHDENSSYDKNFMDAAEEVCDELGVEIIKKTNIPESNDCYQAASELVDEGCTFVFSDSYGHQPYMKQAAEKFSDVQFVSATGDQAKTAGLDNFHNAFASIYEGRYLAGVAAGLKLKEMGETKLGYVGAKPYAEVISGYTSFYLGVKSVVEDATMDVVYTDSWYDETAEKEAANKLIKDGCKLISQHADSMGAPNACEEVGVPNVSYNGSTESSCPNTYIVSSKINWRPYMKYALQAMIDGEAFDTDWCGTLENGAVELTDFGKKATAEGTEDAVKEAEDKLKDGSLKVFDTSKFTVKGKTVTKIMADVEPDDAYEHETNAVKDGYFDESDVENYRSAPYFDTIIDGVTVLE